MQSQPPGSAPGGSGSGWSGRPQELHAVSAAPPEFVTLTLASFAVTKLAYVRLTKQFRDLYMAQAGVDVRFRLTFAGSGVQAGGTMQTTGCRLAPISTCPFYTQARAVIDGLPAELVALALPLDVDRIAAAGLIAHSWRARYPCNRSLQHCWPVTVPCLPPAAPCLPTARCARPLWLW
jgi:sulfate transport system substrate-binding protein